MKKRNLVLILLLIFTFGFINELNAKPPLVIHIHKANMFGSIDIDIVFIDADNDGYYDRAVLLLNGQYDQTIVFGFVSPSGGNGYGETYLTSNNIEAIDLTQLSCSDTSITNAFSIQIKDTLNNIIIGRLERTCLSDTLKYFDYPNIQSTSKVENNENEFQINLLKNNLVEIQSVKDQNIDFKVVGINGNEIFNSVNLNLNIGANFIQLPQNLEKYLFLITSYNNKKQIYKLLIDGNDLK